jgi:RelE toxin of RelE / RelB toxin-antitoxin system
MLTIVESAFFSSLWPLYWNEDERGDFAAYLGQYPEAGDVISGTHGLRKIRWSRQGTGKSSGVRVIYFTRNEQGEIVLLMMYAKSKRANMSAKQLLEIRNALENTPRR